MVALTVSKRWWRKSNIWVIILLNATTFFKQSLTGKWDKETQGRSREGEKQKEDWGKAGEREQAVLAGPWLCARPQLFMRQCTCQELTDKHNSKAERKSNSASVGNAHNAPGGTHLGPFLCCSRINREQGYLSAAWFSSRARSCWNSLCLFVFPPLYLLASFLAVMLVPVGSIFSWLISLLYQSLDFSELAIMPSVLPTLVHCLFFAGPQHVYINYGWGLSPRVLKVNGWLQTSILILFKFIDYCLTV